RDDPETARLPERPLARRRDRGLASRLNPELLTREAGAEGFPLCGAIDIEPALSPDGAFHAHLQRYDEWLSPGYQGAMQYLARGGDRRADPRAVFSEARSIFCVAIPYRRAPAGQPIPTEGVRYARYIDGRDYHDVIAEKLERVMGRVREAS